MPGMNAATGYQLTDIDHIRQSIRDILLTPVGTRVMRRDYGSLVIDLLDHPLNNTTALQLYACVAMALAQWEPRVVLERISQNINQGQLSLSLELTRLDTGTPERAQLDIALASGTTP
jgi:phage baseplate assembly protein W